MVSNGAGRRANINVQRWLGVPQIAVFMIIAAVLIWYLLAHTPWGRYLHAVGSNPVAARLVGVSVDRVVVMSFNVLGTLAGVFFIAVAVQGLTLAGVSDWVQYVLYGATLVAAVAVSSVIGRQRGRA
jgi:ribose/xylose/arabinose/galactoside ABC-type transport system permease subunit